MAEIMALAQEDITVDGITYKVTAMSATDALIFMEKHLGNMETGKVDFTIVKGVVTKYVSKDNKQITKDSFDLIFSRKFAHLQRLFEEVLKFNFDDVFQESDIQE